MKLNLVSGIFAAGMVYAMINSWPGIVIICVIFMFLFDD